MRRFSLHCFICAGAVEILTNCASISGFVERRIEDLQMQSVEVVDIATNKNINLLGQPMRPEDPLLKIKLSSRMDVGRMVEAGYLDVFNEVSICPLEIGTVLSESWLGLLRQISALRK